MESKIDKIIKIIKEQDFNKEECLKILINLRKNNEITSEELIFASKKLELNNPTLEELTEETKDNNDTTLEDLLNSAPKFHEEVRGYDNLLSEKDLIYNKEVESFGDRFHELNKFVMEHTKEEYNSDEMLKELVKASIEHERVIYTEERIDVPLDGPSKNIIISKKRTLEAAKEYVGKKIAILNFANNHTPGGSPYTAGTQQESICRCSTLLPCLEAKFYEYYKKHIDMFAAKKISLMGNHDIIYTPNVCVFKSDESAPKMLPRNERFFVDVITAAAPQLGITINYREYEEALILRIVKILQVAKQNDVEALILGPFGCGGLNNPPLVVASAFKRALRLFNFDVVEFAVFERDERHPIYKVFRDIFE